MNTKQAEKEYLARTGSSEWERVKSFSPKGADTLVESARLLQGFAAAMLALKPKPSDLVLALGATAQHAAGGGGIAGVVAAIGVIASTVVTQRAPAIPPDRSGAAATVLTTLGNRDGYYVMLVAFVIFLAVLPAALPPFMLIVAAGCHIFSLTWLVKSTLSGGPRPSSRS